MRVPRDRGEEGEATGDGHVVMISGNGNRKDVAERQARAFTRDGVKGNASDFSLGAGKNKLLCREA